MGTIVAIILIILITGTLNVVCFLIGAKVGQTAVKGETIVLPKIDPMQAIREYRDRKETEKVADKLETIMHNIEVYDGTSIGQKDVR